MSDRPLSLPLQMLCKPRVNCFTHQRFEHGLQRRTHRRRSDGG
jgi:hypothetical protein